MRQPLRFFALTLGVCLSLAAGTAHSGAPCTIYCNNSSNLSCSSQVGDCQFIIGDVHNFLVCDGKVTVCPFNG
ncbi:MAG TPA: hypothetical protein VMW27_05890 [Thermoanaerobaculia bacterium]|nr:hypothetical protein [Thermoanaerobaculia bacterium]